MAYSGKKEDFEKAVTEQGTKFFQGTGHLEGLLHTGMEHSLLVLSFYISPFLSTHF